ncbi:MAG: alpha-mannosidase [Firmicutes bacterium]|nr:alpha-mannosidase [Bacillota bacterium]
MDKGYQIHLIGNAHIDPVWLWRWQEGFAEVKATFRSALDRMEEFPDFVFTCACAAYYKWVEENDPQMFEEIKTRVKEGRWVIVGGWWIQPDCNIPSGESFVRHSLYSQRYFSEKFGIICKVGYNVDSFGHNGMLPQILKKSGMDYYVFTRPGPHEKELPKSLFWWESEDGSRVLTFRIPYNYGNWWSKGDNPLREKTLAVLELAGEQGIDLMSFYGVGNHGGGPSIANINTIIQLQNEYGKDRFIFSSPNRYFKEVSEKAKALPVPVVKDDLQHHARGCYSTHWETKMYNRKAEHRLLNAEKFSSIANHMLGLEYPGKEIQKAWENVLFNQFHDIMGGCSIKEAYDDSKEFYGEALNIGARALNAALQKISWAVDTTGGQVRKRSKEKDSYLWEEDDAGTPFVVFNPLSWEVKVPVQVNRLIKAVADNKGNAVHIQKVRGPQSNKDDIWNTIFQAVIPPMGYRLYWVYKNKELELLKSIGNLKVENYALENDFIRLEIQRHTGYISKLYDKINDMDVLSGKGAVPVVIDINHCDTWAHDIFGFRDEIGKFADAEIHIVEEGCLRAKLRVINRYNASVLRQDFILYHDRPDIEVQVKLDWREKHKMLKLSFPVNIDNPVATYEIPYGFINRPVNGQEETGQQWIDLSGTGKLKGGKYGLALLNDCKYSFDIKDNEIRMTVVNGSAYADHFGIRDGLMEYMDQGIQEFKYMLVPHRGDWRTAGVVKKAYELNVKPLAITETYHSGPLPSSFEGVKVCADNIIVTVFKRGEDGGGFILRCYETEGKETSAEIEVPMLKRKWRADFGRCEIKTFFIPDDPEAEVTEKNLIEM